MKQVPEAVIFDMDGVLVNSEPFWRKAMIEGFAGAGIYLTEADCLKTQGTRFKEVVNYWKSIHPVSTEAEAIEKHVMQLLLNLIHSEAKPMPYIPETLSFCRSKGLMIGLATSSDHVLMNTVVDALAIRNHFNVMVSAEFMPYGKPHPEVFIHCAKSLGIAAGKCLVIEDSVNGVVAAKAAQMQVIAVPDPEHRTQKQFALADYEAHSFKDALDIIKSLVP
jgi:mannitol-1-/sugar-/sorbitol-6-/2-deoxyglucose-6-phosphatase